MFDEVLDEENSGCSVWADSAYRSQAREGQLREQGYRSRIHRKGSSRRALNRQEQVANHRRSKVRARVEHVFGDQRTRQGCVLVRTKGKVRAAVKIGLMTLTYNMQRLEFLSGRNPPGVRVEREGTGRTGLDVSKKSNDQGCLNPMTASVAEWGCRHVGHADGGVRTN